MRTIWKYVIWDEYSTPIVELNMPEGSRILHVDFQRSALCLWAEVDTGKPLTPRRIAIVGTGHQAPEPEESDYVGTVLTLDGGTFVWHIYMKKE